MKNVQWNKRTITKSMWKRCKNIIAEKKGISLKGDTPYASLLRYITGLLKKDQEGYLFILEVKPGDTVCWLDGERKRICPLKVLSLCLDAGGIRELTVHGCDYTPAVVSMEDLGRTWFLDEQEASDALEKLAETEKKDGCTVPSCAE